MGCLTNSMMIWMNCWDCRRIMELILNEKSLDGQFANLEEFFQTLPEIGRNLKILQEKDILLYKHSSLYSRKVTEDMTLMDLQNSRGNILPIYRDEVRRWKRELAVLTTNPPFWDLKSQECEDSIFEAARRETDVVSFRHSEYEDSALEVLKCDGSAQIVHSAVSTRYLVDILKMHNAIDTLFYLKKRYAGGRLVLEQLDADTESVSSLQKSELDELVTALDRFESMDSWKEICNDNFFNYKSYQPASKKKDYFAKTSFGDKAIDKFRCGQHSQVRCFGYREGDRFYVLMIERDHRVSDTG